MSIIFTDIRGTDLAALDVAHQTKKHHLLNNLSTLHITTISLHEEDTVHDTGPARGLTDSCKRGFTFIQQGLISFITGLHLAIDATVRLQSVLSLCVSSCCVL